MDPLDLKEDARWKKGIYLLEHPLWPVFKVIDMLSMAVGHEDIEEILPEVPDELDTGFAQYSGIRERLFSYKDLLERLIDKHSSNRPGDTDTKMGQVPGYYEYHIKQLLLERELEEINSLLCGPIGCHKCCVGPMDNEKNLFFEIPLQKGEIGLFPVPSFSSPASIEKTPYDQEDLEIKGKPFYSQGPLIIHWKTGPSLILPRGTICPNLQDSVCSIYPKRPITCRRPQIFPYVTRKDPVTSKYALEGKLLAVTDCPYVVTLKDKIHVYASMNELDLYLTQNRG